jgi:Uma2 family endonuclease
MSTLSSAVSELEGEHELAALERSAQADFIESDGEPLDSPWHRSAINLLIDPVTTHRQGLTNYFVGGNMFIYYSRRQAREKKFRGPDFFYVKEVDGTRERHWWWVHEEDGKYPNTIIELLSPSTAVIDRTTKKDIYEQTFRTPEYFCYDPDEQKLDDWRLNGEAHYQPLVANERGWLWSEELGLWVGTWEGVYLGQRAVWLRFYTAQGELVLTEAKREHQRADQERLRAEEQHQRADQQQRRAQEEHQRADQERLRAEEQHQRADQERLRAEEEHQRAEQERQRAATLAAEIERLHALLKKKGFDPEKAD